MKQKSKHKVLTGKLDGREGNTSHQNIQMTSMDFLTPSLSNLISCSSTGTNKNALNIGKMSWITFMIITIIH